MRSLDGAAVALHDAFVEVAEAAAAADGGGNDEAAVLLLAEGDDNGEGIVSVQEKHDGLVVEGRNSVDCSFRIDYFGKARVVDMKPPPESGVERDAG